MRGQEWYMCLLLDPDGYRLLVFEYDFYVNKHGEEHLTVSLYEYGGKGSKLLYTFHREPWTREGEYLEWDYAELFGVIPVQLVGEQVNKALDYLEAVLRRSVLVACS